MLEEPALDGAGAVRPVAVLAGYALVGLVLVLVARRPAVGAAPDGGGGHGHALIRPATTIRR
ncbi:hypothetical protein [Micromonospora rubida]|uniref:hypothetical protein n=1 Tax=Micromonospora rubida TaxID=2697657 RepID=UPI001378AA70|nr:hypothetical protein [Micromonospora rubida]NBE81303.1 hypothetical protein [Micromonospora rubida]